MGRKSQERMTEATYEERVAAAKLRRPDVVYAKQAKRTAVAFIRFMRRLLS